MITLRLPVVIDVAMLKMAMDVSRRAGTQFEIVTFYRLQDGKSHAVDCDKESELREYAELMHPAPEASRNATNDEATAAAARVIADRPELMRRLDDAPANREIREGDTPTRTTGQ